MSVKKVFKSTIEHNNYLFKNGKTAIFTGGRYITDDATEIAELISEIGTEEGKSKHPFFFTDPADSEIDTTLQDRIQEAQAAAVAQVMKDFAGQAVSVTGVLTPEQQTAAKLLGAKSTATTAVVAVVESNAK
jgi:hypothetical protein